MAGAARGLLALGPPGGEGRAGGGALAGAVLANLACVRPAAAIGRRRGDTRFSVEPTSHFEEEAWLAMRVSDAKDGTSKEMSRLADEDRKKCQGAAD